MKKTLTQKLKSAGKKVVIAGAELAFVASSFMFPSVSPVIYDNNKYNNLIRKSFEQTERLTKIYENFNGGKTHEGCGPDICYHNFMSYEQFIQGNEFVQGNKIRVEGSEKFKKKIQKALELIKKYPEEYERATKYIAEIREDSQPYDFVYIVMEKKISIFSRKTVSNSSLEGLAGSIVHEAVHSERYWTGKTPSSYYKYIITGEQMTQEELEAFKAEIDFFQKIKAPKWLISFHKRQDGTHWKEKEPWKYQDI